ncbi:hypothetical protein A4X09_0g5838 [Tilletia walkeri]|uniref:Uncharacterized protein n=1 Tax=Tilletia walkeri TaxID=117179 RepID=A0A8X7T2H6_9BASI|nr:hypothetical protein A4X09_0g5838 [Tilletia walkeri]
MTRARSASASSSSASRARLSFQPATAEDELLLSVSSSSIRETPSRSSAASIYAPTPLRTAALSKHRNSIPSTKLALPRPSLPTSTRTQLEDEDEAQWDEEDNDDNDNDSAPIASRTRRRNSKMNPSSNNNRRSLLAPPSSSSSVRRPSSALGKRRAERRDDDDDDNDFEQDQEAATSEFGVRSTRTGIPPPSSINIDPSSHPSTTTSSRLARPTAASPTKAGSLLNSLRAASPLKSVAARQLGSYLTNSNSGSSTGGAKSRVRSSLGSLGAFQSAVARKSGLRPPSGLDGQATSLHPDTSTSSSLGGGGAGSLPRPRKLSRPSTASEVQYARATVGPAAGSGISSGLPKPRMGSSSLGPAAGHKRQGSQLGAPPDSFSKMVGSALHQPQPQPQASAQSSTSSKALPPPSTSTFKFAVPSSSSSRPGLPTPSGRIAPPTGSTPLRAGPVHPAVASLRPPTTSSHSGLPPAPLQGKLSKMLLPTPDARERGKKRLSGMSLGSSTSMSAILAASGSASTSMSNSTAVEEDKENVRVGKGKGVGGKEEDGDGGRAMSPTMKDLHILNQLQNIAKQSGLSLEHIRGLLARGSDEEGPDRAVLGVAQKGMAGRGLAQGGRGSMPASSSSRSLLAPPAPIQSTPAVLRSQLPGSKLSVASAGGGAMSPSSDVSMALGMGAGAIGEETIDLVNLSLSPPGSIGSPLNGPDDSLMASLGTAGGVEFGGGKKGMKDEQEEEEEMEGEEESDLEVESPLMAIVALRPDLSVRDSSSPRRTSGPDSTREVKLVAGPLPEPSNRSLRARGGRRRSSTNQLGREVDPDLKRELDSVNMLGILSSPVPSLVGSSEREVVEQLLGKKSSTDSEGTARGGGSVTVVGDRGAAEVVRLRAELEQARAQAARQRDLHELKLAEYEEALTSARDEDAAAASFKVKREGSDSDKTDEEDKIRQLQARIEAMQLEQTRARKLYESELAGLEEACRTATERASIAEAERAREAEQAAERARLDEEARHALGEEAERAMVALVEEREQAKEAEARLKLELEELGAERAVADEEREAAEEEVRRELEAESARAVEREKLVRRELEAQEGVVVEALGTRRRVLGECAARAWGDLADLGRNELLLLDGKADMCHFLLAQLELWDGLVSSCYPPGTLSGARESAAIHGTPAL